MSFGGSGGGTSSISTSTDVLLNNPATNQVLTYDSTSAKWKNQAVSAALFANAVLFSTDPTTRPTADQTKVVLFICSTQPTAMVGNDVWLSALGV